MIGRRVFCLSVAILSAFVAPVVACAQVIITEIMYDVPGPDTGREWIEVKNSGSEPVDLSTWKLFEANTNHKIVAVGAAIVARGSFAVIADVPEKFIADNPGFSGQVFDSTFSLSGDGETLVVRDSSGADSDSVSYDPSIGAKGDGLSLQRTSDGRWIAANPTLAALTIATQSETVRVPSSETEISASEAPPLAVSAPQDSQANSAYASQALANTSADQSDLEVTSGRTRLGFVDTALEFRAKVRKGGSPTSTIEHIWSMGDGSIYHGTIIDHAYRFGGLYSVILNSSTKHSQAVSKVSVRILEPRISIVAVTDQYVEIRNDDSSELNLGGWSIQTEVNRFIVGDDTIMAPGISVKFAFAAIPRFAPPKEFIRILSPFGRIFAEWHPGVVAGIAPDGVLIELPEGMTRESLETLFRNVVNSHE